MIVVPMSIKTEKYRRMLQAAENENNTSLLIFPPSCDTIFLQQNSLSDVKETTRFTCS